MTSSTLPRIVGDTPLAASIISLLRGKVTILAWDVALEGVDEDVQGLFVFGHPVVDGAVMDRLPGLKVISNYGVGVDHIDVKAADDRGIAVGNTPGVLDGATADMAFALLLATARKLAEGDRYARGPDFVDYDPAYMLGREIHKTTLGIIGMGRIGAQIARRAAGFEMRILYHNRRRRVELEQELAAEYAGLDELLAESDHVVLSVPLSDETRGLIDAVALRKMKRTATLINIARGPVVDTRALYEALRDGQIYAAGLDVTDPEPLPREHPLLTLDNVTITPHLGSATLQTRQKMAETAVANLLAGLRGQPLLHRVVI